MNLIHRFAAVATALLLSLVLVVPPVFAGHNTAYAHVYVYRGNTEVAAYQGQIGCSGTPCQITIVLTTRDYNRFVRWCGTDLDVVPIPGYAYAGYDYCYGPSTWYISVPVSKNGIGDASTVNVEVTVTKT